MNNVSKIVLTGLVAVAGFQTGVVEANPVRRFYIHAFNRAPLMSILGCCAGAVVGTGGASYAFDSNFKYPENNKPATAFTMGSAGSTIGATAGTGLGLACSEATRFTKNGITTGLRQAAQKFPRLARNIKPATAVGAIATLAGLVYEENSRPKKDKNYNDLY
jgi:hypothetical protein